MPRKALSISPTHVSTPAQEALRTAVRTLQTAQIETASLDARLLLQHVLGISRERWIAAPDLKMNMEQAARYEALIARRALREPVAHLRGMREFWGMEFTVTNATLDPRPDTETVVEAVLTRMHNRNAPLSILDLGTGTGCLLLSLLTEFPEARGTGIDLSREALLVAQENALRLGLRSRAQFKHGNWCAELAGPFDIIVSNPPYIPSATISTLAPEVAQFEPRLALDGGADGLDCYRTIISSLPAMLAPGGLAAFEVGAGQLQQVASIAEANGLQPEGIRKDLQGIPRCILIKHSPSTSKDPQ